jgi:hypothetical protein
LNFTPSGNPAENQRHNMLWYYNIWIAKRFLICFRRSKANTPLLRKDLPDMVLCCLRKKADN